MDDKFKDFKGAIILNATIQGKPGAGDEIAKLLLAVKKVADSDKEPGCNTYRVARNKDSFAVWEEYTGPDAINHHFSSNEFQTFLAAEGLRAEPPALNFCEEIS